MRARLLLMTSLRDQLKAEGIALGDGGEQPEQVAASAEAGAQPADGALVGLVPAAAERVLEPALHHAVAHRLAAAQAIDEVHAPGELAVEIDAQADLTRGVYRHPLV